ncbi:MAG: hypothetical protein ACI9TH_002643 [Kiritimatiellia bacterium]|jgi:hypothetical protein
MKRLLLLLSLSWVFSTSAATIESIQDGAWSDPQTWSLKRLPDAGDKVLIKQRTHVIYDLASDAIIHSIRIAGHLGFSSAKNTLLNVGDIRIQPGAQVEGNGVEDVHAHSKPHDGMEAALRVGPIPAGVTARIRLHFIEGNDPAASPSIIARPGGRLELHGASMPRTWIKLDANSEPGTRVLHLRDAPEGWSAGDEVVVTGGLRKSRADYESSEVRNIVSIDGIRLTLDRPLENPHAGEGRFHSEVANLSRNVIIESADPDGVRGHTMFHKYSKGSISYARFAHLGKKGVLGRYPIHFHRVEDSMRGSSVVGVAIVDSHNRWVTVHGTQYLVVRDCVGYQSIGHGYYLEDATEVYNVFDRNLAIQAFNGPKMKDQALPFDPNDAAGFWWANCKNTFIRNVSCENEEYGYRFDMQKRSNFDPVLPIRQPDGKEQRVDVRTIPLYRFENNEAHTEGFYGMVLAANGNDQPDAPITTQRFLDQIKRIDWTGPDKRHPHIIKGLSIWGAHYAIRPHSPNMRMEDTFIWGATYGIYRPAFDNHEYINLHLSNLGSEPFNRGMDDASAQTGSITVDGLTLENMQNSSQAHPVIHMTDVDLNGGAECHFRNITLMNNDPRRVIFNRGGSTRKDPFLEDGVPYYIHDHFGPGRHAKVVSTAQPSLMQAGEVYTEAPPLTGDTSRIAEVTGIAFPRLLDPVDDEPPATVITSVEHRSTQTIVRGTTTDNVQTQGVWVNSVEARDLDFNFHQWEVVLGKDVHVLAAWAVDTAGNRELTPHVIK